MSPVLSDPRGSIQATAAVRLLVGLVVLVAPRRTAGALLGTTGPSDETLLALRMFAGRDAALGLGALLAARHPSSALRGWAEAGVLADATDALAFAVTRSVKPMLRLGLALVAATATVSGAMSARRLPQP